eukprot:209615-Pleurochrysis_carterae.AAC.1
MVAAEKASNVIKLAQGERERRQFRLRFGGDRAGVCQERQLALRAVCDCCEGAAVTRGRAAPAA